MSTPSNSENNPYANLTPAGLLLWFLRKPWTYIIFLLLLIPLFSLSYWIISTNKVNSRDKLIELLQNMHSNPPAKPNFASFVNKMDITTNEGSPFTTCTDSMFRGESVITLKINSNPSIEGEHYLQAWFNLIRGQAKTENSYVCFYADLSTPQKDYDISQYEGISFKSRLNLTHGNSDDMQLIVSINTPEDNKYFISHEANYFTPKLLGKFFEIKIPFSDLKKPSYMHVGDIPPFNPKGVYRITYSVRGEGQAGSLDIDDIAFYTSQK